MPIKHERESCCFQVIEEKNVDLMAALRWLNSAVISSTGNKLREPERVILKGTWRGLTYEQMADGSEYSTNYLMRDVAPKLWKQLSNVFGRSVGKTNFRVALEAYAAANAAVGSELLGLGDRAEWLSDESAMGKSAHGSVMAARNALRQEDSESGGYWPNQTAVSLPDVGSPDTGLSEARVERRSPFNSPDGFAATVRARFQTPMYGYERELARSRSWLMPATTEARVVRLVGIWGLRGMGKTMLAERLIADVGDSFDQVVCRSLQDKPLLGELCTSVLAEMGFSVQPAQSVAYLLAVMARKSVLLLLEDVEAVLEPKQLAGDYLAGYEGYEDFFSGAMGARGCAIVTGIEVPAGLVRQEYYGDSHREDMHGRQVRSLSLHGLDQAGAIALLQQEGLSAQTASLAAWPELAQRYQGHPMALKAAARVIREIFDGRVDEFLAQRSVLLNDIRRLLLPAFVRLCAAELNILYWLASQDYPLSLSELESTLPISLRSSELISALDSLKQRSLLVIQLHSMTLSDDNRAATDWSSSSPASDSSAPPTFSLPILVKAYAIYQFVGQFSEQSESSAFALAYGSANYNLLLEPVINLGARSRSPMRLSQWFAGQIDTRWQPLESLFAAVTCPAMRLRSAYHFRDATFVKRCKSVVLSVPTEEGDKLRNLSAASAGASAILLIAVHQDGENLYKICAQAQPATDSTVLPESLELRLLDAQETVLAAVAAGQADSFIQLPYFQGVVDEFFEIELVLDTARYRERLVV